MTVNTIARGSQLCDLRALLEQLLLSLFRGDHLDPSDESPEAKGEDKTKHYLVAVCNCSTISRHATAPSNFC